MTDAIVVLTTTAQPDEAARLAHLLVERHLAACVQIVAAMSSIYRWQTGVKSATESLLLVKTTRPAYPMVEEAITEFHRQTGGYETPEILALPIEGGSSEYLSWLSSSVSVRSRETGDDDPA